MKFVPRELDRLADRLFDKIWKAPASPIPDTVYHYTTADGLVGILTSKRVWATDCRSLNDETESELGVIIARKIARGRVITSKEPRLRRFYRTLNEYLRTEDPDRNFVFSLSSRADDLSQWRTYARDGRGFTIGFRTEALLANSKPSLNNYGFSRVNYNARVHDKTIRELIEMFEAKVLSSERSGPALHDFADQAAVSLDWIISSNSVLFKHSSFQSEKEWRINTYFDDEDRDSPVRVRSANDRLVPYMELRLCGEDENCLPISRIGVGPGFRDKGIRFAVEKLCEQTKFEVDIYNADTPYRRL